MIEVTRASDERRRRVATNASGAATVALSIRERWRRRLDRAIFILLLALLFIVAVPYGSVDPWWEGVFEACIFALGALWMIEGMLGSAWLVAEHRLLIPLIALVLFTVAQTISLPGGASVAGVQFSRTLSADPFETWRFAVKLAALVLAAALLLRYTSSRRRLRALVLAVVGVGCASAAFGIFRQLATKQALEFVSPRLAENIGGYAQFINRNHFAYLAEMTLGLPLGLLISERSRRERWPAYIASALLVWAALVMSNSRGGLLGMFAQLAFAALLYFSFVARGVRRSENSFDEGVGARPFHARVRRSTLLLRAALVSALLAVVFVGVVWVGGEPLASRLEALPGDVSAASSVRWGDRRAEVWRATWGLIKEHPLAGIGFGAFRAGITAHHDASGEMSLEQAHDDYLELLASGGVIGAAIFAWFVALFARRALKSLRSSDRFRQAAALGALAGLAAVAVHSLFDFGLHVTADALIFSALVVIAVAGGRAEPQAPPIR
jgi:O-antigen ligase